MRSTLRLRSRRGEAPETSRRNLDGPPRHSKRWPDRLGLRAGRRWGGLARDVTLSSYAWVSRAHKNRGISITTLARRRSSLAPRYQKRRLWGRRREPERRPELSCYRAHLTPLRRTGMTGRLDRRFIAKTALPPTCANSRVSRCSLRWHLLLKEPRCEQLLRLRDARTSASIPISGRLPVDDACRSVEQHIRSFATTPAFLPTRSTSADSELI